MYKMGYGTNVILSVPIAIVVYLIIERIISSSTLDSDYNDRIQKNFIMSFVVGFLLIGLGWILFSVNGALDNQSMQLALYGAGGFMVLNSVVFNWDELDDGSRMTILGLAAIGLIAFSYSSGRTKESGRKK